MKGIIGIFVKAIAVTFLMSQSTTSDTGYILSANGVNEPLALTLCGVALLALGLLGREKRERS